MSPFSENLLPLVWSRAARGGPERRTEIVTLGSGFEQRNTPWRGSRRRYDVALEDSSPLDLHALMHFFEARRGRWQGFRFRDLSDWRSAPPGAAVTATDQVLGVGDGVRRDFQLVKSYGADADAFLRNIAKPEAGSVLVAIDGVAAASSVNLTTGVVTFAAPPAIGATISAGFCFDTPVRFDMDRLDVMRDPAAPKHPIAFTLIEVAT